jgi:hypothetical protein
VTDEISVGLILLVAGGLILVFRRAYTRWAVGYYGRMANAFPWLYPGPLREMTSELFLRWLTIATAFVLALIGVGVLMYALLYG